MAGTEAASRYEPVTACGLCGKALAAGQKQWCSNAHRQAAYRRRHQTGQVATTLPPVRSRRAATVYECPSCEARFVGASTAWTATPLHAGWVRAGHARTAMRLWRWPI
jgi:hypothetical protein